MSNQPPAWHPDPSNPGQLRWWDGNQWTNHTQPLPGTPQPSNWPQEAQPSGLAQEAPSFAGSSQVTITPDDKRQPTLGVAILAGIVALVASSIVAAILFGIVVALLVLVSGGSVASGDGVPWPAALLGAVALIAVILFQLYLLGLISGKIFDRNRFAYNSRWNLVIAFPLAGFMAGAFGFILGAIVAVIFGQNQQGAGSIISLLVLIVQIIFLVWITGNMLIWASQWKATTGKILTIIYAIIQSVLVLVVVLAVSALVSLFSDLVNSVSDGKTSRTYTGGQTVSYITRSPKSGLTAPRYRVRFRLPPGPTKVRVIFDKDNPDLASTLVWTSKTSASGSLATEEAWAQYQGSSPILALRKGRSSFDKNDKIVGGGYGAGDSIWIATRPPNGIRDKDWTSYRVANPKVKSGSGANQIYYGVEVPSLALQPDQAKAIALSIIIEPVTPTAQVN